MRRVAGTLLAGLLTLALPAPVTAAAAPPATPAGALVNAFPEPGTPVASPRTQISLRGLGRRPIGAIVVRGSRTGDHEGRIVRHPDGDGASFIPARRFVEGERVAVRTSLPVRGARAGDYSLTVADQRPQGHPFGRGQAPRAADLHAFATRPDLRPPRVAAVGPGSPAGGLLFAGAKNSGAPQSGPMILDDRGEPVWFQPIARGRTAADVRVQRYHGRPVITWWEGTIIEPGAGTGQFVIADRRYRILRRFGAANGYSGDLHEFVLTRRGTALVAMYNPVRHDLRSVGGPRDGTLVDNVIQELDVRTGLVLFEWHSVGNQTLAESYVPAPTLSFRLHDAFHINSIAEDTGGDLLVSMRNTRSVLRLNRASGAVRWRLGGNRSDFALGPGAAFAWQHDARRLRDGTLSLFDNEASPPVASRSRGLVLALDERRRTARVVREFVHPANLLAASQGSFQGLGDGGAVVGWGSEPHISEFGPDGRLRLNLVFPRGFDTYRATRAAWRGDPRTRPVAAARASSFGGIPITVVFASWNGATEVRRWRVLAGPRRDALQSVGGGARRGFESALSVRSTAPVVAVEALGADGRVLGRSDPVPRAG